MYSNLIKLRKERGILQRHMAKMIGCTVSSYNRKELGKALFNIREMETIQKHFNKSLDEIFLKYECNKNALK